MSDEEVDFAAYDKDEPGESNAAKAAVKAAAGKVAKKADVNANEKAAAAKQKRFQAAIAEKAAKETAQKEIDDIMGGMSPDQKGRMLAAMGVVATPGTKCKYDHEATLKSLIASTEHACVQLEKLKDDYESMHYMGALCDYWKSRITQDRLQINEHAAFKKFFKKIQHLHGLPERGVTEALGDLSFEVDEEAGAGAGAD